MKMKFIGIWWKDLSQFQYEGNVGSIDLILMESSGNIDAIDRRNLMSSYSVLTSFQEPVKLSETYPFPLISRYYRKKGNSKRFKTIYDGGFHISRNAFFKNFQNPLRISKILQIANENTWIRKLLPLPVISVTSFVETSIEDQK